MDWQGAINVNREALQRILAVLFTMAGLATAPLPRGVRLPLLRVLRPAESAVRRLIVIAARGINVKLQNRPAPDFSKLPRKTDHVPSFELFDRRKRFAEKRAALLPHKGVPRLTIWNAPKPIAAPTARGDHEARVMLRLKALQNALNDLPKQAQRLARHQARRATLPAGPKCVGPLRPGYPPAHKKRSDHAVDFILRECHALAMQARTLPPTFKGGGIEGGG
ncbi:hypothetical protein [Ahrensia sp. 13_GOM-1096m]|uniref:hypothetical protein n=1 Tax=Ahrensia sp. 13_GOM-1096m TaxID=1380380 RepID=UPI00047D6F37|nr:hypothetical protein [Ahrensia sp. 13_GOM-1096m]